MVLIVFWGCETKQNAMQSILSEIDSTLKDGDVKTSYSAMCGKYAICINEHSDVIIYDDDIKVDIVTEELLKELYKKEKLFFNSAISLCDSAKKLVEYIHAKTNFTMTRTIHPVGQGAFYSERFFDNERQTVFLAVYDCGSQNKKKLKNYINHYFSEGETIDLLFISHLDEDHVSGIQFLLERKIRVRYLVLPLLDDNTKRLYLLTAPKLLRELIQNPKVFFEDCMVIYVDHVVRETMPENEVELNSINQDVITIHSGSRLIYQCDDIKWCYVPYNYKYSTRVERLLKGLGHRTIEIEDIEKINERKEVKEEYAKICSKGVNNTSLILFSGPYSSEITYLSQIHHLSCMCPKDINSGCLYLGDTDLKQGDEGTNKLIDDMMLRLDKYSGQVGLIQIPHHGSGLNFSEKLLSFGTYPKACFASYGNNNSFGHPSPRVWEICRTHGLYCCGVDDNRQTMLTQVVNLNTKLI